MKLSTISAILGALGAAQAAALPVQERSANEFEALNFPRSSLNTRAANLPEVVFAKKFKEWEYENDVQNAWVEMMFILNQMWSARDTSIFTDIAEKYFGKDQTRITAVKNVIGSVIGADANSQSSNFEGNAELPALDITNVRIKDDLCDGSDPPIMFTENDKDQKSAIIRPCKSAFTGYPATATKETCDSIKDPKHGDILNGRMSFLSGVLFHEITHVRFLTKSIVPDGITDHDEAGYGPLNVRKLVDDKGELTNPSIDPLKNADTFRWLYTEFFWTINCQVFYGPPKSNDDYYKINNLPI